MIWTIPNILTIGRLIAAPCVALVFVVFDRPLADWLAFWIFVGAAVTDYLDGWLARKWGQVSALGKMLDPIADKAIVVIALITLFARPPAVIENANLITRAVDASLIWLIFPAALIAFRETAVSGIREFLGDVKLPVTTLAKFKTTVQMAAIALLLAVEPVRQITLVMNDAYSIDHRQTLELQKTYVPLALWGGVALFWLAAILTILTGWDYFRKAMAHLKERERS